MTREGWQSAILQYRLYIGKMPLRLRSRLKTSRLVEATSEIAIGIVFELGGDDRPLSRAEQELVILAQRADFILREQGTRKMLLAERYVGFVALDRAAFSRSITNRARCRWEERRDGIKVVTTRICWMSTDKLHKHKKQNKQQTT